MKKWFEFVVPDFGKLIGTREDLDRAYARYGFSKVYVLRSW